MRRPELELLEDDLDDNPLPTPAELGLPVDIDLTRDYDDDDDLGLRSLYEHPEVVLGSEAA